MAKSDFNVLGNQRGKVGNVVGFMRKGKQCYRGYTSQVTQSKSADLLMAKMRFATLGKLAIQFRGAVKRGYQKLLASSTMSACNLFVKKNYDAVTVASVSSDPTVDYGAIVLSEGNLPFVDWKTPDFTEESEVSCAFGGNSEMPGADANDQVYMVVYQPDTNVAVVSLPSSRSAGSISVEVPALWSGMKVHVYGFCVNPADRYDENLLSTIVKGEASPSSYVGQGTIA